MSAYPETEGHHFEVLALEKRGENWLAQFAIDGVRYSPFYEPHVNVLSIPDDDFLDYMRSQAMTVAQAVQQRLMA